MEFELIEWLARRVPSYADLPVGIGDDAAVVATTGQTLVTVDMLNDLVDFDLRRDSPRRIGRKALAVNLSDIAAMAGRPTAAVVSLALPRDGGLALARELYEGMLPLAERYRVAIAGGDTNSWEGPLALSITLLGAVSPRGPLQRSMARPGDRILVTGEFGGSILGHHFDFEPRVEEAQMLHARYELHAGIDVSDGLSLDLSRICRASGCGAVMDLQRVPVSAAAEELAAQDGKSALEHALSDGEDFELVLAVPPEVAEHILAEQPLGALRVTDVGEFVAEHGLWSRATGGREPLEPKGYQHELRGPNTTD
jgi:thiamine-monophosphate kinase